MRPLLLVTLVPGRGLTPQLVRVTAPGAAGSAPVSAAVPASGAAPVVAPVVPTGGPPVVPPLAAPGVGVVTLVPPASGVVTPAPSAVPATAPAGPAPAVVGPAGASTAPAAPLAVPGSGGAIAGAGTNKYSLSLRRTVEGGLLSVSPARPAPAPAAGVPIVIGDAPNTLSARLLRGATGLLMVAYEYLNATEELAVFDEGRELQLSDSAGRRLAFASPRVHVVRPGEVLRGTLTVQGSTLLGVLRLNWLAVEPGVQPKIRASFSLDSRRLR